MKAVHEIIPLRHGESFSTKTFHLSKFEHSYHFHEEIEITLMIKSSGQRLVGDRMENFDNGDLVILGQNLPHCYRNNEDTGCEYCVIQVLPRVLNTLAAFPEFKAIHNMLERSQRGLSFSPAIQKLASEKVQQLCFHAQGLPRFMTLLELLDLLSRDEESRELASEGFALQDTSKQVERINAILDYVHENWNQKIDVKDVAQVAHLHHQSLSRFMKQHVGMTFQEYVLHLRCSRAAQYILANQDSISKIAYHCGFENLSNFNRQFRKRMGHSPRELRQFES